MHRWSATFPNETRLYCPGEAAFTTYRLGLLHFYSLQTVGSFAPLLKSKITAHKDVFHYSGLAKHLCTMDVVASISCWHKQPLLGS